MDGSERGRFKSAEAARLRRLGRSADGRERWTVEPESEARQRGGASETPAEGDDGLSLGPKPPGRMIERGLAVPRDDDVVGETGSNGDERAGPCAAGADRDARRRDDWGGDADRSRPGGAGWSDTPSRGATSSRPALRGLWRRGHAGGRAFVRGGDAAVRAAAAPIEPASGASTRDHVATSAHVSPSADDVASRVAASDPRRGPLSDRVVDTSPAGRVAPPPVDMGDGAPSLPRALMGALRSTRRASWEAVRRARFDEIRRFAVLVVGEQVGAQLLRHQRARGAGLESVWRDVTDAVRAEHLEHLQFGGAVSSLREFAEAQGHQVRVVDGSVRVGAWSNPDAKWDRWEIGGAYRGRMRVIWRDEPVDQARFGDLDLAAMRADARIAAEARYEEARARPAIAEALGVDLERSRAQFAFERMRRHPLLTPALLKDGEWFEMDGDLASGRLDRPWMLTFEALIDDLRPNTLVTMVECRL